VASPLALSARPLRSAFVFGQGLRAAQSIPWPSSVPVQPASSLSSTPSFCSLAPIRRPSLQIRCGRKLPIPLPPLRPLRRPRPRRRPGRLKRPLPCPRRRRRGRKPQQRDATIPSPNSSGRRLARPRASLRYSARSPSLATDRSRLPALSTSRRPQRSRSSKASISCR